MPARFVNLDRQTPMLLPCDLRDWLPAEHRIHFILDAVEQIPTGRFGSRTIEPATHSDVAVRYLCANHHPDHDSIRTFRTANRAAFQAACVTVLQLARELRFTAWAPSAWTGPRRPTPARPRNPWTSPPNFSAACAAQRAAGQKPRGPAPKAPSEVPAPKAQYNFTDPESRIMKAGNGSHFEPACNALAAVDAAMLIVGQRVSAAPNDKEELAASVAAISPVVAGDVQAVEQKPDGTPSGVSVYAAVEQQTHHQTVAQLLPQPEPAPLREHATPKERMAPRMKTSAGRTL